MDQKILVELRMIAKKNIPAFGAHGFEHTERVLELCKKLGALEKANMDILLPAALLHDIGRGKDNHASVSAEKTRLILLKKGFDRKDVELIADAIEAHSFSSLSIPMTLEAMILSDADKIDAMGAVGVYRAGMFSGENHRSISDFIGHFHEKLLRLKDLLYFEGSKKIAEERHKFMRSYLKQIEKELKIEC